METQKQTQKQNVKTHYPDNRTNFNPDLYDSVPIIKEIGNAIRREDHGTTLSLCKLIEKRVKSSSYIALGLGVAGVAEIAYGFSSFIKSNSDIELVQGMVGVASVSISYGIWRAHAVRVRENLKSVITEARRQHQESKKGSI